MLLTSAGCLAVAPAAAQVALDGTANPAFKGALDGPDYRIGAELGRTEGGNLFHSFERFGLRTGESATFSGPAGIENVISRVTGGARSDIDGALRSTIPGADFFFLNPAGVVFGPNATLDVRGSFHVSTADELRFSDGAVFSATDPATGSTFTAAPPEAFGFLGAEPGDLEVDRSRLRVPAGEALSLVGGDVTITAGNNGFASGGEAGTVRAEAGRVTLAALGGPGAAPIADGGVTATAFADVRLTDQTLVDASGDGGGGVRIRGGRFIVENRSFVFADNTGPTPARDGIAIEAEAVTVDTGSAVTTDVVGSGAGGPLAIRAGEVLVADGARIGSVAAAGGDAGAVEVEADRLVIAGGGAGAAGIFTTTEGGPGADGGPLTVVVAGELELRGGGAISSGTAGAGDGGRVTVEAGRLLLSGDGASPGRATGIGSQAEAGSAGNAGAVVVRAGELELQDGSLISSGTAGAGRGGDLRVEAGRLVAGAGGSTGVAAITSGTAGAGPEADGGALTVVVAGDLELRDGGLISAITAGAGDAGAVTVEAGRLLVSGGRTGVAGITTEAQSGAAGDAGAVVVRAGELELRGGGHISSSTGGAGNGGALTVVTAGELELRDGSAIGSGTAGAGRGGDLRVEAGGLVIDGGGAGVAAITSGTIGAGPGADGGALTVVVAGELELRGGGVIGSDTAGGGRAGDLRVEAGGLMVDGGVISSETSGTVPGADAGALTVAVAGELELRGGGQISSGTGGAGDGGRVTVEAGRLLVSGDGVSPDRATGIASQAGRESTGDAGALTVTAGELEIADGGGISTSTFARGHAGTITVEADRLSNAGGSITSEAERGSAGDAGVVEVRAGELELSGRGVISSSTFAGGKAGTVTVAADEMRIFSDGSGFATSISSDAREGSTGDAGAVTVRAGALELRAAGAISSATSAGGDAGDVTVAAERLRIVGDDSGSITGLTSQANPGSTGAAGSVVVTAPVVTLADGGFIASFSVGEGKGGSVLIRARDAFRSTGGSVTAQTADADAGDITIVAGQLIDLKDSEVTTSAAFGKGGGGNIFIDPDFVILDGSRIVAQAEEGAGGFIEIEAGHLFRTPDSEISASSDLGIDGEVRVEAPDVDVTSGLVALPAAFVDASALLRESCAAGRSERASSFVGVGRGGVAPGPEDLLPGSYAGLIDAKTGAAAGAEAAPRFEPVGLVMACGGREQ